MIRRTHFTDIPVRGQDYPVKVDSHDCCPECGEPWRRPSPERCTLEQSMMRYIAPGTHIHIKCPVHGSHRLDGRDISLSLHPPMKFEHLVD